MADTYTTTLNLTKPEVGASADTWGGKLNDNADAVDALFDSGPYLKVAKGGTGAGTAADARTNLGLGTMATQAASAVAITGGTATLTSVLASATEPKIWMYETDADTDEKYWRFVTASGNFYIQGYDDAVTAPSSPIAITRNGTTMTSIGLTATTVTINGNVAYHAGNVSSATIAETQITDGSVLARVGGNETVTGTWAFTSIPGKTGGGKFLHYASSTYSGGAVTVSTSDPTGTPAAGDRWVKYVA